MPARRERREDARQCVTAVLDARDERAAVRERRLDRRSGAAEHAARVVDVPVGELDVHGVAAQPRLQLVRRAFDDDPSRDTIASRSASSSASSR